jgi:integrase
MPRKLPPHVERNHVKGHTYLSFRLGKGPRIRLPNDPTSDEFMTAYQAALLGQPAPVRDRFIRAAPGTIAALVTSYMKSTEYIGLRETSKAGYISRLEMLRTEHGHRTVAGLTRERIIIGILQPYADRPGAALDTLKKLRILIRHAINIGWLKHDPSLGIKRPKVQRIRSWTEDEIEAFRTKWPLVTKQRLAFELFLNTGQRRSDVVRMAWSHITPENKITVVQQKTGRRLLISLHRDLLTALAAAKRDHVSILTTTYGKPFTVDGFSQWMRDAITDAGLPLECQPHGLRKATGRRLAEAGATAKMIMSILGHTTLAEAERYTEEADQAGLAEDAVIKLEGHKANKLAQTVSAGLGKVAKTEGTSK